MAAELLNNSERFASADMFSLGITLYEMCRIHERGSAGHHNHHASSFKLPSDGAMWRALREGNAERISDTRPSSMLNLINSLMSPDPEERPTATAILDLSEVRQAGCEADPTIMATKCLTGPLDEPRMARSVSFNPLMIASFSNTHAGLENIGSSTIGTNLSVEVPLQNGSEIDYAALGDRATTPHFTPRNHYS